VWRRCGLTRAERSAHSLRRRRRNPGAAHARRMESSARRANSESLNTRARTNRASQVLATTGELSSTLSRPRAARSLRYSMGFGPKTRGSYAAGRHTVSVWSMYRAPVGFGAAAHRAPCVRISARLLCHSFSRAPGPSVRAPTLAPPPAERAAPENCPPNRDDARYP